MWLWLSIASAVRLEVPWIEQEEAGLCGPAAASSVLAYWGDATEPWTLARDLVAYGAEHERFRDLDPDTLEPDDYPGTPFWVLREYLGSQGWIVDDIKVEGLPADGQGADAIRESHWRRLAAHVDSGRPVVVHQSWREPGTRGHYRVVTGYDEGGVWLIDPRVGLVKQGWELFFDRWRVEGPWLPYLALVVQPG